MPGPQFCHKYPLILTSVPLKKYAFKSIVCYSCFYHFIIFSVMFIYRH